MKKDIYFFWSCIILLMFAVLFGGCGKDDSVTAPSGSTITINPASLTATIAGPITFPLTLTVTNELGQPMENAEVYISGAFAYPSAASLYYFSKTADGTSPVNSGFTVVTDESGTYTFSIIVPATGAFTDTIELRSGSAYGTVALSFS